MAQPDCLAESRRLVARYGRWRPPFTSRNAGQAVLAFAGDVYHALDAASQDAAQLDRAQAHLRILSGLYGILRPLDLNPAQLNDFDLDGYRFVPAASSDSVWVFGRPA